MKRNSALKVCGRMRLWHRLRYYVSIWLVGLSIFLKASTNYCDMSFKFRYNSSRMQVRIVTLWPEFSQTTTVY